MIQYNSLISQLVWREDSVSLPFISLLFFFSFLQGVGGIIFSLLSSNIYWKSQKHAIYMNQIVRAGIPLIAIYLNSTS